MNRRLLKTKTSKKNNLREVKDAVAAQQEAADRLADRQSEVSALIHKVNEKEQALRKVRDNLAATRSGKELVEQRLPTLESQLSELSRHVERLNREAEREGKKKADALKERDAWRQKFERAQTFFSALEVSDLEEFRAEYDELKKELSRSRKQLAEKTKLLQNKDARLKQRASDARTDQEVFASGVQKLGDWLEAQFKFDALNKELPLEWVLEPLCDQLHRRLVDARQALSSKLRHVRQRQSEHEAEVAEHKRLRTQIMDDFKRLQTTLIAQKEEALLAESENEHLKHSIKSLREASGSHAAEQTTAKKFVVEAFNQLTNVRHRFL